MAQIPDKITEIIKKFVAEATKDNIKISEAILFGSYAKGTNHELSDIDIAVVSEDFEGVSFYDCQKLTDAMLRTSIDIETHPYRPEEFTIDNPFVREILEYGIRIV
ncbi:MAG: nucleotidyltransferase [Ignavibacteria bacterium]|nr:nucleotidyltransferase [Ignavibacteria bacterium]